MTDKQAKESFVMITSSSSSNDLQTIDIDTTNDIKPNEAHNSASVFLSDDQFISEIIKILDLDEESKILVHQLLIDGRQASSKMEDDIAPEIYDAQVKQDGSRLLDILKKYIEQQWQTKIEEWLQIFLRKQKKESPILYDRILTRTADYGSRYFKDNPSLSLILQFIFEFDDQDLQNEQIFDDIWKTLILNGRQSLQNYKDYLAPEVISEQTENDTSPLSLSLKESFRQPLSNLLRIINKPDLLELCLNFVLEYGWIKGLNRPELQNKLALNKFNTLIKELKQYLIENNLQISDSNTLQSTEIPSLLNSSLPPPPPAQQTTSVSTSEIPTNPNPFELLFAMPNLNINDDIHRQSNERTMVTMCIDGCEKWQLSDLVQAGELMYINQKFHEVVDTIVQTYHDQQKFTEFIDRCLQSIMFLLKRHQNLEDFTKRLLFKYSDVESSSTQPELNMKMILHILLLKSDFSLSRMIISLLSKRNPVPFLEPSIRDVEDYQFISDIIHVWNYQNPTILSFGIGKCQGKSTLLNTIFMSSFEQSSSSIYFQQTIDIDFGYNFKPLRLTNIADTHGSMTENLLNKIHTLFDGFIIHIDYSDLKENLKTLHNYLKIILHKSKYYLILIRDVPETFRNDCSKQLLSAFPSPIQTFILPNISDPNKTQNQHVILKLYDEIFKTLPTKCLHEKKYIQALLKALFNPRYKEQLDEIYTTITPLKSQLIDAVQNERVANDCFPQYTIYAELCSLQFQLASFNFYGNKNDTDVFELHRQIYELENALIAKEQKAGIVFDLFIKILQSSNMLLCLDLLSTDLKHERTSFVSTSEMSKQLPIQKSLSLEVLWRNAIVCGRQQSNDVQKFLYQQYYEYIKAGYPFEIVDGDNFYFHQNFLCEALSLFRHKKILVISVIGLQNSGKSTLLNYMFGTLFDVRDGRCTRGIYGSLVKSNRKNFDYIMLIDTEGLLGSERNNETYDRRIILFCLAVSHLVIVNMVGEVNSALQNMLFLCIDSLKHMGVTRIPQPTVHFVSNQKADLNNDNISCAIERIISDLEKTGSTIDIKTESFHILPSAFKKGSNLRSDTTMPTVVKTEPDFLQNVQLLCGKLIQSAESVFCRSTEFSDPPQWIKSSFTIFETLQKFSDLTFYRDINERQQDNEVREHIRNKLTEIFSLTYSNQLIEEAINKTENEITQICDFKQNQIQDFVNEDLENVLKLLKASETIRIRSKQFLNTQIIATFNALKTASFVANEREKIKILVRDGEGELRQLIDQTIQSGIVLSPQDASKQFQIMFNNSLEHIQSKFNPDQLFQNALNYIYTNYNIYETEYLPDYQHISNSLTTLNYFIETQLPIKDLQESFILTFTELAYVQQHESIEVHPFTNDGINLYSFEQIESLIYLDKEAFDDNFIEYLKQNYADLFLQEQHIGQNSKNTKSKTGNRDIWKRIISKFRHNKQQTSSQQGIYTTSFLRNVREIIKNQKAQLINGRYYERNMYLRVSLCIQKIIETIIKEMEGLQSNQVRQIQTDLIQKIVGLINTLIINIDNELRPFCLSLSRHLKSLFHICAIGLLTTYYFNEQRTHFQQTLQELNDKENDLKTYFIQMVVPNASSDANYASNLLKQLQEYLIRLLKIDGQRLINTQLQRFDYLNRKSIQDRCDGQLLMKNDLKWLMDYIENPTKIIEDEFTILWQDALHVINRKLIEDKSSYNSVFNEFFFCLQGLLNAIKTISCPSATFVQDVFQSQDSNSLNVNENLTHKKRCMAILLYRYMSGEKIPQTIIIDPNRQSSTTTTESIQTKTYKLKKDVLDILEWSAKQRPPSAKLRAITKDMSTTYDRISIDNFAAFLQNLINGETNLRNELSALRHDFDTIDKQDTYGRLLDKIRGCPNLCPCCNRPCDVDHTQIKSRPGSKDNQHRCTTGHSLRAMNGYKFEATDEASLLMCEHIKDDQIIIIGPQRIRWAQFKFNHNDWNFASTLNEEDLAKLHGKFLTIWTKIGPQLCQKHNMKYVVFNAHRNNPIEYESFHWILLLDGSGSMAGTPWRDLLQAVDQFLKHRRALNTIDRITIITFSDQTFDLCFNQDIKNVKLTNIKDPAGQTNFSSAFARVNECIKQTKTKINAPTTTAAAALNYAIIFMTDGDAKYPEKELNQLVKEHGVNIRFWTLVLGGDLDGEATKNLEQISDKMHGSYYNLAASSELSHIYAEIAKNTNRNT